MLHMYHFDEHAGLDFTHFQRDKSVIYEPRHEKTNIKHMRKQRCRSASR